MKLQTSVPPRRDGTLTVTAKDGRRYAFSVGEDGLMVGDVLDDATVAQLLDSGLYWPANDTDFDEALRLSPRYVVDDVQGDDEQKPLMDVSVAAPKRRGRKPKAVVQ